ncbi:MAG: hypothetical protein H6581_22835 [Bacteroidia bacterium]|nr:hypothetical protein [Bacteroidia bacterium]
MKNSPQEPKIYIPSSNKKENFSPKTNTPCQKARTIVRNFVQHGSSFDQNLIILDIEGLKKVLGKAEEKGLRHIAAMYGKEKDSKREITFVLFPVKRNNNMLDNHRDYEFPSSLRNDPECMQETWIDPIQQDADVPNPTFQEVIDHFFPAADCPAILE